MAKILKLYNTFTKALNPVELSGKLVQASHTGPPIYGSLYICGPTVYSDCHVGHALTYIRSDLLRRFLKSVFNVKLITVMNITDIDDKILAKTNHEFKLTAETPTEPTSHPYNKISGKYFKSFVQDMATIRCQKPDLYIKVSKQVPLITKFISKLERNGQAYRASNGDIYFRVKSVPNYIGRVDSRQELVEDSIKHDQRDFALWKKAKSGEPIWTYTSSIDGQVTPGRPGWHVQCSALSSAIFGRKLDIHYGGKDLIFPHHYNEEACCCAFHQLDTSNSLHMWTNHWLHSGHMVLGDTKMSKSVGNVIAIKEFVDRSSVNALRLLCVHSHYRSDIVFDGDLLEKVKDLDHKISAFNSFLSENLTKYQNDLALDERLDDNSAFIGSEVENSISSAHSRITSGVCEDLDLNQGLESIVELSRMLYSKDPKHLRPCDLIAAWSLLMDWSNTCGLSYGLSNDFNSNMLLDLTLNFRQSVRLWAIQELKARRSKEDRGSSEQLLKECDKVRDQIDELGFVIRDPRAK